MIKDKVAIVTGARRRHRLCYCSGIISGWCKSAAGARRMDRLESLQSEIIKNGGEVFIQKLDVTIKSECDVFVDAVLKKWGTIDILVNNAGLQPLSFFKNLKIEEWNKMIDVNIRGVLYCTAAVITPMLNKKSGHIVNISSVAGRIVYPAGSVYCATKHAITAFSEGLRQEFSQRSNIRITCIEPGVVTTELINTITDKALENYVERTKQMEVLQAEDIANAIVFAGTGSKSRKCK